MSEKVRVLYGTRIGQVGRIVERHAEQIPVYRGGLLPDIFPGPSGLAGYVPGRTAWVVEFVPATQERFHDQQFSR